MSRFALPVIVVPFLLVSSACGAPQHPQPQAAHAPCPEAEPKAPLRLVSSADGVSVHVAAISAARELRSDDSLVGPMFDEFSVTLMATAGDEPIADIDQAQSAIMKVEDEQGHVLFPGPPPAPGFHRLGPEPTGFEDFTVSEDRRWAAFKVSSFAAPSGDSLRLRVQGQLALRLGGEEVEKVATIPPQIGAHFQLSGLDYKVKQWELADGKLKVEFECDALGSAGADYHLRSGGAELEVLRRDSWRMGRRTTTTLVVAQPQGALEVTQQVRVGSRTALVPIDLEFGLGIQASSAVGAVPQPTPQTNAEQ